MNVSLMRALDRYLGVPLCLMLGVVLRILPSSKKLPAREDVRNILVIKFFGLGSILFTTPAIALLKDQFPHARISYLSFSSHRELLERLPPVDRVLTVDTSSMWTFIRQTLALINDLRSASFDIVFDFEFFSKYSSALNALSRAPVRIGFELPTRWRSLLVTHTAPLSKKAHVVESFCRQVFIFTEEKNIPPLITPAIFVTDEISLAAKFPPHTGRMICVNVNAGETFLERRWNAEKFALLVSRLSVQSLEDRFFFIGTRRERAYAEAIIQRTSCRNQCFNIAGNLTLPELLALLRQSDLLISNDSGPLHFAAALGTRVVGLYGPETPRFYGPLGDHVQTVYKAISCSPCMNIYDAKTFTCPFDARCMKEIEVEEVERIVSTFSFSC